MRFSLRTLIVVMLLGGPALAQYRRDVSVEVPEEILVWEYRALGLPVVLAVLLIVALGLLLLIWMITHQRQSIRKR